jgi:hypothetical protein
MLSIRLCLGAAAIGITILVVAAPHAALAGGVTGSVTCDDSNPNPACHLGAGSTNSTPGSSGTDTGSSPGNQPSVCHDPKGKKIPCQWRGGWAGGDGCYYKPTNPSPSTVEALGGQPSGPGAWYLRMCPSGNAKDGVYSSDVVWERSAPAVSPEVVAHQAVSQLRLPAVSIVVSPSGEQLVNLPTWLALESGSWARQSATAAVPGVKVTATATPLKAVWDMGNGDRVVCHGPGTVWRAGMDPAAKSPDCGYTYRHSSSGAPGNEFTIQVSISWGVSWQGAGRSGTVPDLTTVGDRPVRVAESQALVTG